MKHCIYCGHQELSTDYEGNLECRRCGLVFTNSEYAAITSGLRDAHNQHQETASSNSHIEEIYQAEEENLNSVWILMQNRAWDKALEALIPSAHPPQHPLEFTLWRNVCQLAPTLTEKDLQQRYSILGIMRRNLRSLKFYLPLYEGQTKYKHLLRLSQALWLMGQLEVNCLTDYSSLGSITDKTNDQRVSVLQLLAEALEEQGPDPVYGTDYLKMSVQLYRQCLLAAREFCNFGGDSGAFISVKPWLLQISPEIRQNINAKIDLLNENIKLREPEFVPQEKIPDPKNMPVWMSWLMVTCWIYPLLLLPGVFMLKDALEARELGYLLLAKTDDGLVFTFLVFYFMCVGVWMLYINHKYGCREYKDYFERLEQQKKTSH